MKDKQPKSEQELLLLLLDNVNRDDEYNWVEARIDELDAREAVSPGRIA
jgi:hypothetical protein